MRMHGEVTELNWKDVKKILQICVCLYVSACLGVRITVCVDVRSSQMMIWLTGVSRADLRVPRLDRAER